LATGVGGDRPRVLFLRPPGSRVPHGVVIAAHIPVVDVVAVPGAAERVLREAERCGWLVLTSPRAAVFLAPVLGELERLRRSGRLRVAAVGPRTREELERAGLGADLVPGEYRGAALASALAERVGSGGCVVLARSEKAVPDLPEGLRRAGVRVVEVTLYRVVALRDMAEAAAAVADKFDYVAFTSPSIVRAFTEAYRGLGRSPAEPGFTPAAIGPTTAAELRRQGYPEPVTPRVYTVEALVEAIAAHWAGRRGRSWEPG